MKMEVDRKAGSSVEKLSSLTGVHYVLHMVKDLMLTLVKITAAICKSILDMILPSPEKSVRGQIVLITGAGSDIGRELALQFADLGCTVVCVDTDVASNKETMNQVNHRVQESLKADSSCGYLPVAFDYSCDVYDQSSVMSMARSVEQDLGRIDILINNTIMSEQPLTDKNPVGLMDVVNMNMISNFWTVLAVLPSMIERKHGHIVAISSKTDICSSVDKPPCSSAQFAVAGLMDSINEEFRLEENNIHITCVHPCAISIKPNMVDTSDMRIHELSSEFAAKEIITAVRQNRTTLTIPRNLLFWINVFRTMPQNTRHIWQNMVLAPSPTPQSHIIGRLQQT